MSINRLFPLEAENFQRPTAVLSSSFALHIINLIFWNTTAQKSSLRKLSFNITSVNLVIFLVSQDCNGRDKNRAKWSLLYVFQPIGLLQTIIFY